MTRHLGKLLCAAAVSFSAAAHSAEPVCPSSIDVEEAAVKEPGWEEHKSPPKVRRLKCSQQMLLLETKEIPLVFEPDPAGCVKGEQRKLILSTARDMGYRTHLICVYEGTTASLSKVIPTN